MNPVNPIEYVKAQRDFRIVEYCSAEVDRQGDGPLFVARMYLAWQYTCLLPINPTEHSIQVLGALVTGRDATAPENLRYRQIPVTFASGGTAAHHQNVPRLMSQLVEGINLSVDEWISEFLRIHPFEDGNGRVASLLHNLMRGTLEDPHPLPNYTFV